MLAYLFNGVTLPIVSTVTAPMPSKVGAGATPGRPGSYPGVQRPNERKITVSGTLIVDTSFADLNDAWAQLCSAHDTFTPAQLCVRDGWYFWAVCDSITDNEFGIDHVKWTAQYTAADPYQYNATATPITLTAGATFVVGGYKPAAPVIAVTVSATGGTITLTNSTTGDSFTLTPAATGSYIIDCRLQSVTVGGADATGQFTGSFPLLPVGSNTIPAPTTTGSAAFSSAALTYNARSL